MGTIVLDASGWVSREDFFDALLPVLRAPDWHGRNLDALDESIRFDTNIDLKQPYRIEIRGSAHLSKDVKSYLEKFVEVIDTARAQYGYDVRVSLD